MNPTYYYILHIFSLFVLTAHTFMAFSNPAPENRKKTMMIIGSDGLLVLISGFGLLAKLHPGTFPGWAIVKLVCWLGLMALGGIVYRRPQLRGALAFTALSLLLVAVVMVYVRPF
ncbi:MAG: hypothetical protein EXS32_03185 [Opitutus sp.]|nr:hypothetical protein [Opitutus sp.]